MERCKYCGAQPRIIEISDIYYAQCTSCAKYHPYQFMAITKASAERQWNDENIRRIGNQEAKEKL